MPELPNVLGHNALDWTVVAVFATVYLGMFLGGLGGLAGRTHCGGGWAAHGVALADPGPVLAVVWGWV